MHVSKNGGRPRACHHNSPDEDEHFSLQWHRDKPMSPPKEVQAAASTAPQCKAALTVGEQLFARLLSTSQTSRESGWGSLTVQYETKQPKEKWYTYILIAFHILKSVTYVSFVYEIYIFFIECLQKKMGVVRVDGQDSIHTRNLFSKLTPWRSGLHICRHFQ